MAENLTIPDGTKEDKYEAILPQLSSLVLAENDTIANLANVSAVLKQVFGFFWVGFYRVKGETLVLGPFQGTLACTRIPYGKGVCGTAWMKKETLIVPNVDEFPGHIACDSRSRSEIAVPLIQNGKVVAVLDVDSDMPDFFDDTDRLYLSRICLILSKN